MTSDKQFLHALTISVIRYAQHCGIMDREIDNILNIDLSRQDLSRFSLDSQQLLRLIRTISDRTCKPFSGLQLIEFMKIGDFGIAGYVLLNCRNMMQVQEKYQIYHRLMGNVTRLTVRIEGRRAAFCWQPILELPAEIERIVMEFLVTSTVVYSHELTGQQLPIEAVEFNWPEPDDISAFVHLLGPNITFGSSQTALYFDRSYLKLRVKTANSELLSVFEDHARERYEKLIRTASFSDRVTRLLQAYIPSSPRLATIAAELGLSQRTLQLHLKDEGTTFLKLRDTVRYQYARKALQKDNRPAAEISLRLGFSEPSAFFRTFKRWSGKSPGQYREELKTLERRDPESG